MTGRGRILPPRSAARAREEKILALEAELADYWARLIAERDALKAELERHRKGSAQCDICQGEENRALKARVADVRSAAQLIINRLREIDLPETAASIETIFLGPDDSLVNNAVDQVVASKKEAPR